MMRPVQVVLSEVFVAWIHECSCCDAYEIHSSPAPLWMNPSRRRSIVCHMNHPMIAARFFKRGNDVQPAWVETWKKTLGSDPAECSKLAKQSSHVRERYFTRVAVLHPTVLRVKAWQVYLNAKGGCVCWLLDGNGCCHGDSPVPFIFVPPFT